LLLRRATLQVTEVPLLTGIREEYAKQGYV
jgi:hypothetical protein